MTLAERIIAKTKVNENGCRLWQESLLKDGYALIRYKGKKITVHRAAWMAFKGPIPDGMSVLHSCDIRHCTAEEHLFLGTYADNSKDAVTKGRQKNLFPSGDLHPNRIKKLKKLQRLTRLRELG